MFPGYRPNYNISIIIKEARNAEAKQPVEEKHTVHPRAETDRISLIFSFVVTSTDGKDTSEDAVIVVAEKTSAGEAGGASATFSSIDEYSDRRASTSSAREGVKFEESMLLTTDLGFS